MVDPFEAIPSERRALARSALARAFAGAAPDAVQPVGGGASGALIYRADVAGRPYLMRIETRRDAMRNPPPGTVVSKFDCRSATSVRGDVSS